MGPPSFRDLNLSRDGNILGPFYIIPVTMGPPPMNPCYEYKADWVKYGKRAGPIRNALMLKEQKPDLVVAFYPGGNGTLNMVGLAKRRKVEVLEVWSTGRTQTTVSP